jgi:hypothetical protein
MEVIRFQTNVYQEVALKFATGLPAPSTKPGYADQVSFTLCDGRIMYVAPFVAQLIYDAGFGPSERFRLGKFEMREGQAKKVRWKVEPIAQPVETPLEANLRRSAEIAKARKPGAPVQWPAAQAAPAPVRPIPARRNDPGIQPPARTRAAAPPAPLPPPAPVPPTIAAPARPRSEGPPPSPTPAHPPPEMMNGRGETGATILARCYSKAIDIALMAVAEAEMKSLRITPTFEDIRAMATVLHITETAR